MRTFQRLVAIALSVFIAASLSLPADAQPRPSADQLLARQRTIENNLSAALAACDQRRFNRGLVELRAIADVVETSFRRERDAELRRQLAAGAVAPTAFQITPALNTTALWQAIAYWEQQGRELERRCREAQRGTTSAPNQVALFVEGGVSFGHSTLAVDPGAFVPVNETLGFGQAFVGGGIEARSALNLLNRNIAYQLGSFPLGGASGGFTFRLFDDGAHRNVDAPPVAGDVRHSANWSATGYIGFPQVIQQPTGLPFQTLIITPTVGVTYQEDTLKSVQTSGGITNTFEKTFGRTGATVGLNFEVPAGNFSYGLITGLTMLPSTTVNGTSSLGLPAQAKIDSQANFHVNFRLGIELSPPEPSLIPFVARQY